MSVTVTDATRPSLVRLQDVRRPRNRNAAVALWFYASRTGTGDGTGGTMNITWTPPVRDATAYQWTIELITVVMSTNDQYGFDVALGHQQWINGDAGVVVPTLSLRGSTSADGSGSTLTVADQALWAAFRHRRIVPQAGALFSMGFIAANTNGVTHIWRAAGTLYLRDADVP